MKSLPLSLVFFALPLAALAQAPQPEPEAGAAGAVPGGVAVDPNNPILNANWVQGPGKGPLGAEAEITIPEGFRFTGGMDTRKTLESMGNPTGGDELGFLAPDSLDWFVVFAYDDSGYIKDDEKEELDADDMLESMQENTKYGNEERRKRGWPEIELVGWVVEPNYNPQTNNLEWATTLRSVSGDSVNHNTRLLGRHGVMRVILACDPGQMQSILPTFRKLLEGFSYVEGKRYAEYVEGDKIAEYGLIALVAGGAGAVAAKAGLFAVIGKFLAKAGKLIIVGVVAVGGFIAKLFGRNKEEEQPPSFDDGPGKIG